MSHSSSVTNPMVIFWLGVLTGALVAGFIFMYHATHSIDYSTMLQNRAIGPTTGY